MSTETTTTQVKQALHFLATNDYSYLAGAEYWLPGFRKGTDTKILVVDWLAAQWSDVTERLNSLEARIEWVRTTCYDRATHQNES